MILPRVMLEFFINPISSVVFVDYLLFYETKYINSNLLNLIEQTTKLCNLK
jgi:hypothetical protein